MSRSAHRRRGFFIPVFLTPLMALVLAACQPPPPAPIVENAAAIGISVQTKWATMLKLENSPDTVIFARVEDDKPLLKQERIIQSNFRRGEMVYLLNAPPGRYVAVACTEITNNMRVPRRLQPLLQFDDYKLDTTYFPGDLILKTEIDVRPGEFVMMGRFRVERDVDLDSGDAAQLHYYDQVDPNIKNHEGTSISDPENSDATKGKTLEVRRDTETRKTLLTQALKDLRGSGWMPLVQRRLDALGRE